MRITNRSKLAFKMMVLIAHDTSHGRKTTMEHLATTFDRSESHTEDMLRMLVAGGLVVGKRGPGGGYVLSRSAEDISVSDIFASIDPEYADNARVDLSEAVHVNDVSDTLFRLLFSEITGLLEEATLARFSTQIKDLVSHDGIFHIAQAFCAMLLIQKQLNGKK